MAGRLSTRGDGRLAFSLLTLLLVLNIIEENKVFYMEVGNGQDDTGTLYKGFQFQRMA